jgi:hypothetical protein
MKWIRRVLIAGGVALIAYAAWNALRDVATLPYLRFLAVSAVFADALVMPLALAAGAIAARLLPQWIRVPAQAALSISAAVTLIAIPLLLGYGRSPLLPSALPRDYSRGLLIVLSLVWTAAAVAALIRWFRRAGVPRSGSRP